MTLWNWILKVLKCKKINIPTVRAQREDEKNGVICLVIKFTSGVMVWVEHSESHFG